MLTTRVRILAATSLCAFGLLPATVAQAVYEFVGTPTLTMDPNGTTPLAGVVDAVTTENARVTLTLTSAHGVVEISIPGLRTTHAIPVLGMKPDTTYTIDLTFTNGLGDELIVDWLNTTTPELPADFPNILVSVSEPENMEPGYLLLDRFARASGEAGGRYTIILDPAGDVVWYSTLPEGIAMRRLENGNLLWRNVNTKHESDLLGNELPEVALEAIDLHHDLFPSEHGTYLSLSKEAVEVNGFPTSTDDPNAPTQTVDVRDDLIVEFAADGSLLNEWSLMALIDETRVGHGSLATTSQGLDWAHSNAVAHNPIDDSIIVSARHQDAVVSFSRATGALKWILGPHENWKAAWQPFLLDPVGTVDWQYHQHAPMVTPSGNILLFDNHNFGISAFSVDPPIPNEDIRSRAVEFAIDEENMEVTQVWEYGPDPLDEHIYSFFISDADWMPQTGNVQVHFGGAQYMDGVTTASLGFGNVHTRVIEVTHETPAERVFDVMIYNPTGRIATYRSERIPSLYPGGYAQCNDGVDNDNDGHQDMGDHGCGSPDDNSERSPKFACDDGQDNDADGFVDRLDPGCANSTTPVEDPQCDDGVDNDGDTLIDFDDPACTATQTWWEDVPIGNAACGLGFEMAPFLMGLGWLCRRRRSMSERLPVLL